MDLVNEDAQILVELAPQPGLKQVSLTSQDIARVSAEALGNAMGAIQQMARRTQAAVQALPLPERPSEIEVSFHLKLTSEAGVVLAKAGAESILEVKLTWKGDDTRQRS